MGVITVTGEINGGKKTGETVTVSIAQGSGTSAIAQELKDAGLIGNTTLFKLYSRTHGGDGRYQYGDFTLEKGSSYQELIDALCSTVSYRETVTLTLPEGWNSFQMAKAAAEAGLCTEEEYLAAANAIDYDFDWMKDISTDENKLTILEGFLYPETYSFYTDATARDIVTTQLREFEKKVLTEEKQNGSEGQRLYPGGMGHLRLHRAEGKRQRGGDVQCFLGIPQPPFQCQRIPHAAKLHHQ